MYVCTYAMYVCYVRMYVRTYVRTYVVCMYARMHVAPRGCQFLARKLQAANRDK